MIQPITTTEKEPLTNQSSKTRATGAKRGKTGASQIFAADWPKLKYLHSDWLKRVARVFEAIHLASLSNCCIKNSQVHLNAICCHSCNAEDS